METIFKEMHQICVRDWRENDIPFYAELVNDERVMKFIGNGKTRDEKTAALEIGRFKDEIRNQGWSRWAVSFGVDGPMLGYVGFAQKEDGIDFGLRFLYQHWNSPYPYVASCLALEYGFENVGFEKIYAMNHVDHSHALGFTQRFIDLPPRTVSNELGVFNVFDITRENYLGKEIEKNRRRAESYCRRVPRSIQRLMDMSAKNFSSMHATP